jgi:RNA-directed DNA polymerase
MSTDASLMYGWETLPWHKLERSVFKLQKRIYRAARRGDTKAVRRLQRLLRKSRAAKLLAVRRVTQDNRGKNTAGVDGVVTVSGPERLDMASALDLRGEASPVRRVYIPKQGTDEFRPLGIPTMRDRAAQTLVKLLLEPEWEAGFEPNSYGFRPGRSCWDAIQTVFLCVNQKAKFVLDADIAKCFDRIDHEELLKKVGASPTIRRQLRAWLKAGYLDGGELFPTEAGTPQGGTASPLLANIALHGLETLVRERFPERKGRQKGEYQAPPNVVRYADDFVVLHEKREVVEECQRLISEWLKPMGLELKPSKTRITHTLESVDGGTPGFDFLGFTVRQFRRGRDNSVRNAHGQPAGFSPAIKPSKASVQRHVQRLREIIDRHRGSSQEALIAELNPVIRGWCRYHAVGVSSRTFQRIGHTLFRMLYSWARRRHAKKGRRWVAHKYWRLDEGRGWEFRPAGSEFGLYKHESTPITRHVKVQGGRSPFDGDWVYWSGRQGRYPGVKPWMGFLLKRQAGKCRYCGLYFRDGDVIELDHIVPKSAGGKTSPRNLQLLHGHCHDRKSAQDCRGMHDKHPIPEERNEGEPSRSVLEPSRGGDAPA